MSTSPLPLAILDVEHDGMGYRGYSLAQLKEAGVPEAAQLGAVKRWLCDLVDADAERRRNQVVTPGAGQALEYQEAQAQAAAALKAPSGATEARYPMLAATIGIDIDPETGQPATDVLGVARSVQAARDAWTLIGSAIRRDRLKGKAAIEAAATIQEAGEAYMAIDWSEQPAAS